MAVYLGNGGLIQLQRSGLGEFRSELNVGDVDPATKRFSFDFPNGTFVTGDRIRLQRVAADGSSTTQPLDFVAASGWEDGLQHADGEWFVHVDAVGGLRLFKTWDAALQNKTPAAITLQAPSGSYPITASMASGAPARCLGEVTSYELSTNRSAVDVTSLGDAFQQQVSGLISGGGSLDCFWDWQASDCSVRGITADVELAHYAHQLVLRQQLGSQFRGVFFLKRSGVTPITDELDAISTKAALFYAVDCLITNVGMAFEADQPIRSKISFVTTGEIQLLYTVPNDYLLQEDTDKINLETDDGKILLEV
jgi:hypothetical protein